MNNNAPLAERMRPHSIDGLAGQEHLKPVLSQMLKDGHLSSMILWGPPGIGKTTLANIIAEQTGRPFYTLSAISSGVKEVRAVIARAGLKPGTILFIDEIHRFNKAQQDALLGAVETGTIVLIGATTENPSFEVISALLSRCQVYTLNPLEKSDLEFLLQKALSEDELLKKREIHLHETEALLRLSGGDARKLLNRFELVVRALSGKSAVVDVTNEAVMEVLQQKTALYDKSGEQHYDIISAFIKSVRGSDPNAAVYWLARMLEGGEDPVFIARRLLILSSEDIGLANPTALPMATSCFQAVQFIGMPEARIILSQTTVYLAASPKSNASYAAVNKAMAEVKASGDLPVPLHLRNAPTKLMKNLGYGQSYKYAHDFTGNFTEQEFLPEEISGKSFYTPGKNPREKTFRERLEKLWKDRYDF